ncbi:M17 family metallopeptidase [Lentibacillus saliphilus]|uniref:M17 family metallopeptidase n=1 Tax=Lentibacillus saliphilus TaxID=2737028 RepID=UPI001C306A5F|nr:leucyl aminopeptidase family protein [Lentibacillus saliphilus]
MAQQAYMVHVNDARVTSHNGLKQFTDNQSGDFFSVFAEDTLLVVLKPIEQKQQSTEKIRMVAGEVVRQLSSQKIENVTLSVEVLSHVFDLIDQSAAVTAFVEGWHLGAYSFASYQSTSSSQKTALTIEGEDIAESVAIGEIRAAAMAYSRDLMNDIPTSLNPATFPERLKETFADSPVTVTVLGKKEIEEQQMNGVLTVNQGSIYDPAFVELSYQGDSSKPLIALVGKGVTFDTGGISLKSGRNLSDMRMDMGGAAAVAGAMKLLADSNAQVNVVALIPIVENAIDRKAVLPGDVIQYKDGQTVQIGNTDAEGRLILADGLIRAGELNAKYVVDIATLTGAIGNALGSKIAGVFGDEALSMTMKHIGSENGDAVWPMPLIDAYDAYLKSDYADFCNISSKGEAGSITAALFLRRFVPESCQWLHVDMAGVMEGEEAGYYTKMASGFGARLLADYAVEVSK